MMQRLQKFIVFRPKISVGEGKKLKQVNTMSGDLGDRGAPI